MGQTRPNRVSRISAAWCASGDGLAPWLGTEMDVMMRQPVTPVPDRLAPVKAHTTPLPTVAELGLAADPCPQRQTGGRPAGIAQLKSFLEERGRGYRFEMSSPVTAPTSCSRLSPYLAFGCLSMREVYQASQRRRQTLRGAGAADLATNPRGQNRLAEISYQLQQPPALALSFHPEARG